jgi:flagellar basal body-associated protein FliL
MRKVADQGAIAIALVIAIVLYPLALILFFFMGFSKLCSWYVEESNHRDVLVTALKDPNPAARRAARMLLNTLRQRDAAVQHRPRQARERASALPARGLESCALILGKMLVGVERCN